MAPRRPFIVLLIAVVAAGETGSSNNASARNDEGDSTILIQKFARSWQPKVKVGLNNCGLVADNKKCPDWCAEQHPANNRQRFCMNFPHKCPWMRSPLNYYCYTNVFGCGGGPNITCPWNCSRVRRELECYMDGCSPGCPDDCAQVHSDYECYTNGNSGLSSCHKGCPWDCAEKRRINACVGYCQFDTTKVDLEDEVSMLQPCETNKDCCGTTEDRHEDKDSPKTDRCVQFGSDPNPNSQHYCLTPDQQVANIVSSGVNPGEALALMLPIEGAIQAVAAAVGSGAAEVGTAASVAGVSTVAQAGVVAGAEAAPFANLGGAALQALVEAFVQPPA